jgi:hypothetical protein
MVEKMVCTDGIEDTAARQPQNEGLEQVVETMSVSPDGNAGNRVSLPLRLKYGVIDAYLRRVDDFRGFMHGENPDVKWSETRRAIDKAAETGKYLIAAQAATKAGLESRALHLYRREMLRLVHEGNVLGALAVVKDSQDYRFGRMVAKDLGLYAAAAEFSKMLGTDRGTEQAIRLYRKAGLYQKADALQQVRAASRVMDSVLDRRK